MHCTTRCTEAEAGRSDRKSTRLNSSHEWISYAVFCLKKKRVLIMSSLSITRHFGLGLTPGKLRGLQRISHPNGMVTVGALDQTWLMIHMMTDASKKKA